MQNVAGSLPGLSEGDRGGRCIAETAEENLRLTLDLQRSGTSDRDRIYRTEFAALTTGLLLGFGTLHGEVPFVSSGVHESENQMLREEIFKAFVVDQDAAKCPVLRSSHTSYLLLF
ncbi:hypothetical protein Y032_0015g2778 [Ancylostoma ceylanicum]|nr:hypothetical protein Y032_0015g2778 [Ancylostoma ceylanicum]